MAGLAGKFLDIDCPINWDWEGNTGLLGEWAVPPVDGWRGGPYLPDLTRGRHNRGAPLNGTLTGAVKWAGAQGRPGGSGALGFSGGPNVNFGTPTALVSLQVPMTLTGWLRADSFGVQDIFSQYLTASNHQLIKVVRTDSSQLNYYCSTSGGSFQQFTHTQSLSTLRWYFWAVVMRGTVASPSLSLWVDRSEQTFTPSALSSTPDTTVGVRLGTRDDGTEAYSGLQDGVSVYNRALASSEVVAVADQSRRGNPDRWRWVSSKAYLPLSAGGGGGGPAGGLLLKRRRAAA